MRLKGFFHKRKSGVAERKIMEFGIDSNHKRQEQSMSLSLMASLSKEVGMPRTDTAML